MGRKLQLVCTAGGLAGRRYDVEGVELVLGRAETCSVQIPDTGVSREHARIFVHNGAVWVRDAGSRNGVLVNGKRIQRPATVGPGDTIHVGDNHLFSLEWLSDEAERPRPSVAPAGEPLPPPPAPAGPPRAAIAGAVALAVLLLLGVAAAVLSG
jgi:hypothetical protein